MSLSASAENLSSEGQVSVNQHLIPPRMTHTSVESIFSVSTHIYTGFMAN